MLFHRRVFAFDHWASLVALDAVSPVVSRVPQALARLNHILGASRVWLARVTGEVPPFALNPSFDVVALRRELAAASAGWETFLATQHDTDLARLIVYNRTQQVPLVDILTHVPLHGQQHRGQINVDLRSAGIAPPSIDYIHAARLGLF